MTGDITQTWCARMQYAGLKPFILGTITMPHRAQHHEIEAAIYAHAASILPTRPELLQLLPGALIFSPREED